MKGYTTNIEKDTLDNEDFRRVLYTSSHSQLVLMAIEPKDDIGEEAHDKVDQFFRVEKGEGVAILEGEETKLYDGSVIIVPAGTRHNIINTSETEKLKLYTIYSPANHIDGRVHETKADAVADTEDEDFGHGVK